MIARKRKRRPQATRIRKNKTSRFSLNKLLAALTLKRQIPWRLLVWVIFVIMPLALFVGVSQWIQNPENLRISSVEVSGDFKVLDKTQLKPVIEPFTRTNLYLLDAKGLEQAIEDHPWVNSASMTKVWPDKLKIRIFEQKPVAYWGKDKMLADNGEIINATLDDKLRAEFASLPVLYSPTEKGRDMAANFIRIRKWMQGFPLKIVEFKEDTRGSWKVLLENGLTLKIGRSEQQKRIRRFMVGYRQRLQNRIGKITTIDLRYTNGFAVQWKKGLSADSVLDKSGSKKG